MFSKISRYRKLPDVVTADAGNRFQESKTLRLLPEVSGIFAHTVEEGDRLDHLAYKYFKQPRRWWRICDANPEFMSPQALLGKEPIVTDRFPVTWNDEAGPPPWAELRRQLVENLGVLDAQPVEEVVLVSETQTIGEQQVTVHQERYERAVVVIYNQMIVSAQELADVVAAQAFEVGQPQRTGRVGKSIIIPPNVVG